MRTHHLALALLAAAVAAGSGCIIVDGEELRLTELRVTGETDTGRLDVEVHLFDRFSHEHLGCAGQNEGLEDVDQSDVTYHVDAWFRDSWTLDELEPWQVAGRMLEVQVVEDDLARCPDPPGWEDDMIGVSGPVDHTMLHDGPMLSFGRVMALRLVID